MLLDLLERSAILEQRSGYADQQRQMLLESLNKLDEKLEVLAKLSHSLQLLDMKTDSIDNRVQKVEITVNHHDTVLKEVTGGLKVVKWLWAALFAFIIAATTYFFKMVAH